MRTAVWTFAVLALGAVPANADTTDAACEIYKSGSDSLEKMVPCKFSQRQGYITISRQDGITHELEPVGHTPGNFRDSGGQTVFRQNGLGDQGLVFRFPDESVFVYWNTAVLQKPDLNNPTWPFTTDDYDATTLLRCRGTGQSEFATCPAGILRMEDKQASVVVLNPNGEQFTINFMTGYVNATNREAQAQLNGDIWVVTINGQETYEVPIAAIEGD